MLALSATPIPRTLHMSLSGLRDISVIDTPPEGRRPIRTNVGEYDEELVRIALEREHARDGLSFYLHNRVETIEEAAAKLQQLALGSLPRRARQMPERELEERMHAFLAGDADVLVSTTIIESGIDIPQANTRCRRARRHARARPALPDPRAGSGARTSPHTRTSSIPRRPSSRPRRARLTTLADHTELGAGFQIAMRDLEIRGAGDLLGAEQSGHVAALGFELYVEMLNEASAALRPGLVAARPVRVDARVDAYVPAAYVAAEALKIDLHRRIVLVENEDEPASSSPRLRTGYGPLPEPVAKPLRDPGGEAEARTPRSRLPRLPGRARDRGAAGLGSADVRRFARRGRRPSTRSSGGGLASRREPPGGARAAGCHSRLPDGRLNRGHFRAGSPNRLRVLHEHSQRPPNTPRL